MVLGNEGTVQENQDTITKWSSFDTTEPNSDYHLHAQIEKALLALLNHSNKDKVTAKALKNVLKRSTQEQNQNNINDFVEQMAEIFEDPMQRAQFFKALNQYLHDNFTTEEGWQLVDEEELIPEVPNGQQGERLQSVGGLCKSLNEIHGKLKDIVELNSELAINTSAEQGNIISYGAVAAIAVIYIALRRNKKHPDELAYGVVMPKQAFDWNKKIKDVIDNLFQGDKSRFPYRAVDTADGVAFTDLSVVEKETIKKKWWQKIITVISPETVKEAKALRALLAFLFVPMAIFMPAWIAGVAVFGGIFLYYGIRAIGRKINKRRGIKPRPKKDIIEERVRQVIRDYLCNRQQCTQQTEQLDRQFQHNKETLRNVFSAAAANTINKPISSQLSCTEELTSLESVHKKRHWLGGRIGQFCVLGLLFMATTFITSSAVSDIAITLFATVGITLAPWTIIAIFAVAAVGTLIALSISKYKATNTVIDKLNEKEEKLCLLQSLVKYMQKLETLNTQQDAEIEANNTLVPEEAQISMLNPIGEVASSHLEKSNLALADILLRGISCMFEGGSTGAKILQILLVAGLFGSLVFAFPAPIIVSVIASAVIIIGLSKLYRSYKEQQELEDKTSADNVETETDRVKHKISLLEHRAELNQKLIAQQKMGVTQHQQQALAQQATVADDSVQPSQNKPTFAPANVMTEEQQNTLAVESTSVCIANTNH